MVYQHNLCVDTVIYEGVLDFLDDCQAQHKTLACVTNKPYQASVELLRQLNLLDRFALVIGGDSLTNRKPHPEPLLHAMQHFSQQPAQTLMIGDSSNDVEAARRAGIDCIVVSYGYNHGENIADCQPQQVVDRLVELLEVDRIGREAWNGEWFFDGGRRAIESKKYTIIESIENIHDHFCTIWTAEIGRL